jgi:phospholipid-transporting ATPase
VVPLGVDNLLLRGSSLKNTEWVLGLVVYSGHDTKIMRNSSNAKFKMSKIEKSTNLQIIYIFCVQLFLSGIAAIIGATWMKVHLKEAWYLSF